MRPNGGRRVTIGVVEESLSAWSMRSLKGTIGVAHDILVGSYARRKLQSCY
jgi:hypothetical protein